MLNHRNAILAVPVARTFNRNRKFQESTLFDEVRHGIASELTFADIDFVIFASRFDECQDIEQVFQAMSRFRSQLKGKRVIYVSGDSVSDRA